MFSFSLNNFYTSSNYLYLSLTDFKVNISTLDSIEKKKYFQNYFTALELVVTALNKFAKLI